MGCQQGKGNMRARDLFRGIGGVQKLDGSGRYAGKVKD